MKKKQRPKLVFQPCRMINRWQTKRDLMFIESTKKPFHSIEVSQISILNQESNTKAGSINLSGNLILNHALLQEWAKKFAQLNSKWSNSISNIKNLNLSGLQLIKPLKKVGLFCTVLKELNTNKLNIIMNLLKKERDWLLTEETNFSVNGSKPSMTMNILSNLLRPILLRSHQLLKSKRLWKRKLSLQRKRVKLN